MQGYGLNELGDLNDINLFDLKKNTVYELKSDLYKLNIKNEGLASTQNNKYIFIYGGYNCKFKGV